MALIDKLAAIADAIWGKTGGTEKMTLDEMATEVAGIKTGGDVDALIDRSITEISSDVESIGDYCFYYCTSLTSANLPSAITVGKKGFYYCTSLTSVDLPSLKKVDDDCFSDCESLASVNLPLVTIVNSSGFRYCTSLKNIDLPLVKIISGYAFNNNSILTSVILRADVVTSLSNVSAFTDTPIASGTGYIYVPSALIEDYKVATNWATYAEQFRTLEDYTVDGTTTGELDESKI